MCKAKRYRDGQSNPRIDECIKDFIWSLKAYGFKTKASCCGHSRYPLSVVCEGKTPYDDGTPYYYDLISGKTVPRKRNFYKRDKKGFYYIPEVCKVKE